MPPSQSLRSSSDLLDFGKQHPTFVIPILYHERHHHHHPISPPDHHPPFLSRRGYTIDRHHSTSVATMPDQRLPPPISILSLQQPSCGQPHLWLPLGPSPVTAIKSETSNPCPLGFSLGLIHSETKVPYVKFTLLGVADEPGARHWIRLCHSSSVVRDGAAAIGF